MEHIINRTKRSWTISSDKNNSQLQSGLLKIFQHSKKDRSNSTTGVLPPLYLTCQNNDIKHAEVCLKQMEQNEIDFQYPPYNETVLHLAVRNQQKELIQLLLRYGAQRSLKNTDNKQAYDLADAQEIKDLFKRPKSSRFAFQHSLFGTNFLFQQKIKCESCSLVNDFTFYEWELVDRNASQKALRFRRELKPSASMSDRELRKKLYSIKKGYINARLQDIQEKDRAYVYEYFKRALVHQDPYYIVTAYTTSQSFTKLLNTDMARNVIHDLKNGCSKFSCDCLYSTEDGTKSITNIFLHHIKFQKLGFQGRVYRGIVLPKNTLDHYKVNSCIITTTFLSTSKNREVALGFGSEAEVNPMKHSFFCIYDIVNHDRTAIDISQISEFTDESEVLILPYSAFLITNIEEGQERTQIHLREQCLTQMFGNDAIN